MQYAIDVLLTFFDWLFRSEFPRLFVLTLQFLESQSYATNASLIKAFGG